MMQIKVNSTFPKPRAGQLWVFIDRETDPVCRIESLRDHPAWDQLERRRKGEPIKSPYLAAAEPPLLYLPAAAAPYWEGDEQLRVLAAMALDLAADRSDHEMVFVLDGAGGADASISIAEALAMRAYRFTEYKPSAQPKREPAATLVVDSKGRGATIRAVNRAVERIESVNGARDLVNEPGSIATPAEIEKRARAVAKKNGLAITVLQEKDLAKQDYNGLLTVGRGGNVPPRMIVLKYQPKTRGAKKNPHLGLLGKGITFDTGGVSIKPSSKMWQMKGDMAGAAAVLYAMEAIGREKPAIPVTAVIVTAQNYVDANSVVPGDIFKAKNGKTVQVDNTDAEGRLVLTDGMWRMGEEKVTHLVDVATLTGACQRALGNALSGAFGQDEFVQTLIDVSEEVGEPCWQLPLVEEYRPWLDCEVADLNNMSSVPFLAGATIAALFLREFLPENVKWIHLDIAGTFIQEKSHKYFRPGATGVMVRTLTQLAHRLAG